jgi:hypothetical protein
VRDIDHESLTGSRTGQLEDPHRQPGADAETDCRLAFEAAGEGDLAEGRVALGIDQFVGVGRRIGRMAEAVVRRRLDDDGRLGTVRFQICPRVQLRIPSSPVS